MRRRLKVTVVKSRRVAGGTVVVSDSGTAKEAFIDADDDPHAEPAALTPELKSAIKSLIAMAGTDEERQ